MDEQAEAGNGDEKAGTGNEDKQAGAGNGDEQAGTGNEDKQAGAGNGEEQAGAENVKMDEKELDLEENIPWHVLMTFEREQEGG